jgi:hypothetical protein
MQTTAQRFQVPAGFSGWWCYRKCGAVAVDPELGSPARCPKCHKPTAVWVPPSQTDEDGGPRTEGRGRQPAGRALATEMAGVAWERKRPRDEDARRLFEHMHAVIENPELNPSLRELDEKQAKS